jgi:hypothetical protein
LGGETSFNVTSSTFSNLSAGNSLSGQSSYGGAVYTESNGTGIRLFVSVTFISNAVVGNKGNFIFSILIMLID